LSCSVLCGAAVTHVTENSIFLAAAVVERLHHHLFDQWQIDDDDAAGHE